ncbi:DUF916 domain-containing protein [Streptomyces sp. A7024]|uniref:DUF916 domain-containing protein n=2 Tax=Streptomyces coryli TaxID=1128680 RepID=A0A6G4U040_9ACTN|nr:DUF916 domain-containing protein [Streptomyces coryli]
MVPATQAAAAGAADNNRTWDAAPTGVSDLDRDPGRPFFYAEGAPGAVLEDAVAVTNRGDKPLTVRLRGADAYNKGDGSFAIRAEKRSKSTGAWLAFARTKVTVPPRTRAEVPFSVTVPRDATPGDHPGAVVVESASGEARSDGIRLHLRVAGPQLAAIDVEKVSAQSDGIHYTLVNRGNTALSPKLAVRAKGFYGDVLRHGPRDVGVELLPGQRARLTAKWPGTSALDSVDVRLTVTAAGGARASGTTEYTAVPWGWIVLVVLVGGGAAAAWWRRRAVPIRTVDAARAEIGPWPPGEELDLVSNRAGDESEHEAAGVPR